MALLIKTCSDYSGAPVALFSAPCGRAGQDVELARDCGKSFWRRGVRNARRVSSNELPASVAPDEDIGKAAAPDHGLIFFVLACGGDAAGDHCCGAVETDLGRVDLVVPSDLWQSFSPAMSCFLSVTPPAASVKMKSSASIRSK